jgi:DNA-binding NarL/FixJ family response regulator
VTARTAHAAAPRVVLLCRDLARQALIGRHVRSLEVRRSAGETVLAVSRAAPHAVVLDLADFGDQAADLLAALRRAQPDVPIYAFAQAEDEPLARELVRDAGLADYFVGPDELRRFGQTAARGEVWRTPDVPIETQAYLASESPAAPAQPPSRRPTDGTRRYFEAACALAHLAADDPATVLRKGSRTILEAAGTGRGSAFVWNPGTGRLETCVAVGSPAEPTEDERTTAQRAARTGERLALQVQAQDGMRRLLCVPIRGGDETLGAICLSSPLEEPSPPDLEAVEALTRALARLVRAVTRHT